MSETTDFMYRVYTGCPDCAEKDARIKELEGKIERLVAKLERIVEITK